MGKHKKYTQEKLLSAAQDVIQGKKSDRRASLETGIGRQTIRNKVKELIGMRQPRTPGVKAILSQEMECEFVNIIQEMADCGFSPTPKQILSILQEYSEVNEIQNTRFKPTSPSSKRKVEKHIWQPTRKWLYRFLKRNNFSRKKPKGLNLGRIANVRNPFLISGFYDLIEKEMNRLNIVNRPECIWNLEESGFPMDPNNTKTVSFKGNRVIKVVSGTGHENITVLAACNAAGSSMPPLIIFSSKEKMLNSIPLEWSGDEGIALPGTWYGLSKNGWMTSSIFEDWFASFAKKTRETRPIMLLLDGHISHLNINTRRIAAAENISILKLPSHTTSTLQPLDLCVFGPLKTYWAEQMNNWIKSVGIPVNAMTKKQFVNNLSLVWNKGLSPFNIRSGFEDVGIFPFNREKYDKTIFEPKLLRKYGKWIECGRPENIADEGNASDNASMI